MKLGAHIKQSSEDHMLKMNRNLTRLLEENGRMKRSMKALKRKIGGLHEEKEALWEKVSEMERQLKERDRLLDEREKGMQNLVEALAEEWRNGRIKEKTNRKRKAVEVTIYFLRLYYYAILKGPKSFSPAKQLKLHHINSIWNPADDVT